jgi:hypothetical protein
MSDWRRSATADGQRFGAYKDAVTRKSSAAMNQVNRHTDGVAPFAWKRALQCVWQLHITFSTKNKLGDCLFYLKNRPLLCHRFFVWFLPVTKPNRKQPCLR